MLQREAAENVLTRAFGPESQDRRTQFVAIAGNGGLRWIVPTQLGLASRALANWRPYKPSSLMAWRAIQVASHAGVLSYLPGTRAFDWGLGNVMWSEFGWTRPYPPHLVAYVGTMGPHQKLVCNLVDPCTYETALVVKFPLIESAKKRLRAEFDTLVELEKRGLHLAPRALRMDELIRFTVQSYLPGKPGDPAVTDGHVRFLSALVDRTQQIRLEDVRRDLQALRNDLVARGFLSGALLDRVDRQLGDGDWAENAPAVRTHGDFAPWNLKTCAGEIHAVDWEASNRHDLPYLDLHHFEFSLSFRLGRRCVVPWDAYTSALKRSAPSFSKKAAEATFAASKIAFWMRSGFIDRWSNGV